MALSDQLSRLAARAKQAEDRAAAAQSKAKADLEKDVKASREAAQAQAAQLRKNAEADKSAVSEWWKNAQRSWTAHVDAVEQHISERRAEHDLKAAQRNAQSAEDDAAF